MHDWELLQDYVTKGSDAAFAAVVERHTNMVYAFCFRQMRNRELAEEATQTVFIILARKAAGLKRETVLAGWLFKTARFAIANALKIEARKRRIQTRAMAMAGATQSLEQTATGSDAFALLDDALATLPELDRNAVLLKYFEQQSLADVGSALGVSTDAAEKRISRAIGKLHSYLSQRGVVLSIVGMGGLLTASASQMAPSGLAAALTKSLAAKSLPAAGAHSNPALVDSTLRAMQWARWKPALTAACVLLCACAVAFVARLGGATVTPAPANTSSIQPAPPIVDPASDSEAKLRKELRDIVGRLGGDPAERDMAEQDLLRCVRRSGQPAFAALNDFAHAPTTRAVPDVSSRAARIVKTLTQPEFLWGRTTGATFSHPPRPAAGAARVVQSTDDGLFALDSETGALQWRKPERAAPSVGSVSGTTVLSTMPFDRANPHATLAAFGDDGTVLWTHAFDALYPPATVTQIRTSLAMDAAAGRLYITAGADEKECLSVFTTAGDEVWSKHFGTLCGDPVLIPNLKLAVVGCENSIGGGDPELRAVHVADGAAAWSAAFNGLHRNCVGEGNGRVYAAVAGDGQDAAFNQATHLVSRDATNGVGVWDCVVTKALPAAPQRVTLEYLGQSKFGEHSWHEPGGSDLDIIGVPLSAAQHQWVISQTRRFLFGVDAKSGVLKWSTPCLRLDETHFAERNGVVFAGTDDGLLLAVRASDGRTVWSLDMNTYPAAETAPRVLEIRDNDFPNATSRIGPIGEPTVLGTMLYATTAGGWTFALRLPEFTNDDTEASGN